MRKSKDDTLRQFSEESEARKYIIELAGDFFEFYEEIWAIHPANGKRLRLDAVSVCESSGHVIGWEIKKSHLFKAEFSAALKQAADYRGAILDDPKLPGLKGTAVEACLVFPDWDGLHDNGEKIYGKEADGMRHLASHFRVGTFSHYGLGGQHHILIGEQAIWHSHTGWTKNADGVLLGKRPFGSQKHFD